MGDIGRKDTKNEKWQIVNTIIRSETPRSDESNTTLDLSTMTFKQNKVRIDIDIYLDTAFWERTTGDQRQRDLKATQTRHRSQKKRNTIFTVLKKVIANLEFYTQLYYRLRERLPWVKNSAQLRRTLYDHMNCSPTGSSVHGDSPSKNNGVGCHALFQGIFPTQGSNPGLLHCRQIIYHLSHEGSPRTLEWVAYPFSRRSSHSRNWTRVSCTEGGLFTSWATREAH